MLRNFHLVSLGCARNRVDSEVMLGNLFKNGWQPVDDPDDSQAVIINTCGFIESAKEESIDTILEMAARKKENQNLKIVVAGCLTQRYRSQLTKGLPEVDLFLGTDQFTRVAEYLGKVMDNSGSAEGSSPIIDTSRTHYIYDDTAPRINTLAKASAYVKVAEGCQHTCAFCIIPAIRGKLRSREISSVVKECESLAKDGVKEINLIAQDLAAFGRDKGRDDLLPLLRELVKVEGIDWYRVLYVYPENMSEEFLQFMAAEEKIVKYVDIPVQHASDKILKAMKRDTSKQQIKSIVTRLRDLIPGVAVRTSVMVGFPGETQEDFQELYDFVQELQFDHLGCFTYSKEEGTVAAKYDNHIEETTKLERQEKIMGLQKEISRQKLQSYVGSEQEVLVEGVSEESEYLFQGRLSTQAPEVDGVIYINDGNPQPGKIQRVKITDAYEYDLVGHIVDA